MAKPEEKKPAQIFHFDLYGKREDKYDFLNENSLSSINWTELHPQAPELFFVPKDFGVKKEYDEGFSVNDLFPLNNVGIVTAKDGILINEKKEDLLNTVSEFYTIDAEEWFVKKISYRPFDNRFVYFDTKLVERSREKVMQNFIKGENVGLNLCKQFKAGDMYQHIFISNKIIESSYVSNKTSEITSIFPLYLYPDEKNKDLFETGQERTPNLNVEIVNKIAKGLGIPTMLPNGEAPFGGLGALDILDYIYAVLHSPSYREKYKEFLKIDFPRVPFPSPLTPKGGIKETQERFWNLVKLGTQIRQIHLLESPIVEKYITQYPEDGDNKVGKIFFEKTTDTTGKVYVNYEKTPPSGVGGLQYFNNVPEVAWNFYIGGYQPAQKWLKDRKDRELSYDDILHYQKIIVALTETDRIMREIDTIGIE
ncbi:hypothetical protein B0A58_09220 [Flavobacterium branchiophilum NBRC 15030 = ATCC 35035]|uniref:Type ISP restriction-modification enzyme LLaBIII C-terminal specificity domain-containing protein n=1 Tax=Flavobacterium branchiophilum TaxID=55197 RepID=A0A543G184_9FLAO|nr:type ISP restriction/modification enzyme [Flavobacterium branchiophilum]OXA75197.1 hypothetical protein B0A58_09220 [Flavobacterium branchiophilum NBRC 15030 = ATCC 35035]TQM39846.1 hypothetical protein BC670_0686 [Flavobacterium branchiophilum]GEM56209.1 hypothetical protein FB1_24300 [Flavobacterium branchiophilum NBRC 15030 = ATCC 35035]